MPGRLRDNSLRDETVWNRLAYSIIALIMTTILSMKKSTCKSGTRVEAALDKLLRRFSRDASGFLVPTATDCYSPSESDDNTSTAKIDADQCNTCSISSSVGLLSSLSEDVEELPTPLKLENAAVQCSLISSDDKSSMEFQTIEEEYTEISVNQVMPSNNLIKDVDEYLKISRNVSVLIGQGIEACINGADKAIDAKQSEGSSMLPNDILKRSTFSRIGQLETIPESDSDRLTDTEEPNDKLASRSKYFNLGSDLSQFKSITLLDTSRTLNEIQKHHESLTSSLTNLVNRIKEQSDALSFRSKNSDRHSKEKEPTLSNAWAQGDMQNSKHSPNSKEKHKYKYRNKSEHNVEKHKHRRRPSADQENKSEGLDFKNSIMKNIEYYMSYINQGENAGTQLDVFESDNATPKSSESTNHEDSAEQLVKQPEKSNANKEELRKRSTEQSEDKQKLQPRSSPKAIKKKGSPKHVELSDLSVDTDLEKSEEFSIIYDSEKAKKPKHHVSNATSSKKLESKPERSENCLSVKITKESETSSLSANSSTSRVKKPSKTPSSSPKTSLSSLLGGNCVHVEEILSRYASPSSSRHLRESFSASSVCSSTSDKVKHTKSKSRNSARRINESCSIPSIRNDRSTSRVIDKEKSRRFSSSKKDIRKCEAQPSPSSISKTRKNSHRSTDDDPTDSTTTTTSKNSSKSLRRKSKEVDAFIEKHRHSGKDKDKSSISSNKRHTVKIKELKDQKSKSKMPFEKLYKSVSSIYQNRESMEKILSDSLPRAQSAPQRCRDFNLSKCSLETKSSIPETSPGTYSDGFLTKIRKSAELSDTKRILKGNRELIFSSSSNKQKEEKPTKARKLSMTGKERQLKSISSGDLYNNKMLGVKREKKSENSPASPELFVRKTKDSMHSPVFRDKNVVELAKLPDSIIVPPISFEPVRKRVSKKPSSTEAEAKPVSAISTHRPLAEMPDGTYSVPCFVMNVPKSPVGQSRTSSKSKQVDKSESNHSNVSDTFNDISQLTSVVSSFWDTHKAESTTLNKNSNHKDESVSHASKSRRLRKQESINISDSDSSDDEKPVLQRRRSSKKSHKCHCDRKRSDKTVDLFEASTTRLDSSGHRSKGNQMKSRESLKFNHSSNMSLNQANLENAEAEYSDAFAPIQSYLHPRSGDAQEDSSSKSMGSKSLQAKFYELEQHAKKLLQSVDKKIMPQLSKNKSLDKCTSVSTKESKTSSVDKCVSTEECFTIDDTKLHSWFEILNTTESSIRVLREKVADINALLKKSDKNYKYLRSLDEGKPKGKFEQLSFEKEDAVVAPGKKRTRQERSPYYVRDNSKFKDEVPSVHYSGNNTPYYVRQASEAVSSDTSDLLLPPWQAIPVRNIIDDYVKHKTRSSPR